MKPLKYQRGWVWGTALSLVVIAGLFLGAASLFKTEFTQTKETKRELSVEGIASLDINYPDGKVSLKAGDGDVITVREYTGFNRSETTKLKVEAVNGTATMTGSTGKGFPFNLINFNNDWLEVTVPQNLLDHLRSLRIRSAGGDLYLPDLTADEVEINTASGDIINGRITAKKAVVTAISGSISNLEIQADALDISTISGKIRDSKLTGGSLIVHTASGTFDNLIVDATDVTMSSISGTIGAVINSAAPKVSTTSGNVQVKLSAITMVGHFSSVSGNIELIIPDHTVEVEYSTVSGKIKLNTIQTRDKGRIAVTTTSGNITINAD